MKTKQELEDGFKEVRFLATLCLTMIILSLTVYVFTEMHTWLASGILIGFIFVISVVTLAQLRIRMEMRELAKK